MPEDKTAPYSGYWDKKSLNLKQEWAKSKWPYSGEIDIMEVSGRATRLYHAGAVYHKSKKKLQLVTLVGILTTGVTTGKLIQNNG